MSSKEDQAFCHILGCFPEIEDIITSVGKLGLPSQRQVSVADAVTRTVIGQMLSRHAARTIYERIEESRLEKNLDGVWKLSIDELRQLGVSGRKAKAITEFGMKYDQNPNSFEAWRQLQHSEVVLEVSKHWGLSTWSADILSIFYFGLEDVFPENDGTIKRAISIINEKYYSENPFDPYKASPYKTYFSMYLWQMIDENLI
ncbi:MAG: hypothetical protein QM504_05040 [Pseudomonadota bacterium]